MAGISAQRRAFLADEVQRLTGTPARWALAGGVVIDPTKGVEVILRTANLTAVTTYRKRRGSPVLETSLVTERKVEIEVRVRSIRPDVEAQEVYCLLESRLWRGTSTPRFNSLDMAFIGLSAGIEVPGVAEYEGVAGATISECVGTLTLTIRDQDVVTDTFDVWIDSTDVTRTEPDGPKTEHIE